MLPDDEILHIVSLAAHTTLNFNIFYLFYTLLKQENSLKHIPELTQGYTYNIFQN